MNPLDVCVFNEVARTLSFTAASRTIGQSRSAVSKKIRRLEEELGVVLLNRTTRQVQLTEAGRNFYEHSAHMDRSMQQAASAVRDCDVSPVGTLILSIPSSLGAALMPALMNDFCQQWSELDISIHFDDRPVNVIDRQYDVSICIADKLADSSLVGVRLASTRKVLAASPEYLNKAGVPQSIEDLAKHSRLDLVPAGESANRWQFHTSDGHAIVEGKLAVAANCYLALVLSACLDRGVLYVPEIYIAHELASGRLVSLLTEVVQPEPCGIFAVYPHRKVAAKVRVLLEFVREQLEQSDEIDRWTPLEGRSAPAADSQARRKGSHG